MESWRSLLECSLIVSVVRAAKSQERLEMEAGTEAAYLHPVHRDFSPEKLVEWKLSASCQAEDRTSAQRRERPLLSREAEAKALPRHLLSFAWLAAVVVAVVVA